MLDTLLVIGIIVVVIVLAFLTSFFRWIFKVNERFDQNKEIIRLLKKLANEPVEK